jgi:hypothetical protein
MISLPLSIETEALIQRLSAEEKKRLAFLIQAFVSQPVRPISQVMDDMAEYAQKKGLNPDHLDGLLKD